MTILRGSTPSPRLLTLHRHPRATTCFPHAQKTPRHHHHQPRFFSTTTTPAATQSDSAKKSSMMDKDAINTSSNEYSKSGGGDAEAAHTDTAFDPAQTGPEETKGRAAVEQGGQNNSVDWSPANKEFSDPGASSKESRKESSPEQERGERRVSGSGGAVKGSGKGRA